MSETGRRIIRSKGAPTQRISPSRLHRVSSLPGPDRALPVLTKVFCIGFHKTGTKSLAAALKTLGYRVTGPNGARDPDIAEKVHDMAWDLVDRFDAFQDNPWPILFKELDQRCPGSRFVLTLRDTDDWLRSIVGHFGRRESQMRRWIYGPGCPEGNEQVYRERFERHNREVRDYFRDRPGDLLELSLARGDGWQQLCPFLGLPVASVPFPHANRASDRIT